MKRSNHEIIKFLLGEITFAPLNWMDNNKQILIYIWNNSLNRISDIESIPIRITFLSAIKGTGQILIRLKNYLQKGILHV